ncbi:MAG: Tex family protein, partial [bacterium]|nr:Tex family protein [bacterium]
IEAGLEPLAQALHSDPSLDPEEYAQSFVNNELGIVDVKAALEGARHILMEHFAEDAELLNQLREYLWQHAIIKSIGSSKKKETVNKFSDYFDYSEAIKKIPSHRALALFRGRRESVLQVSLILPETDLLYGEQKVAAYFNIDEHAGKASNWLMDTVRMAWKIKLFTKLELELLTRLREMADEEAIKVFSKNLRDLLLAAPAGPQITIGLDPGIRTGVKVVVVDATGKLLDYSVVFPFAPQNEWHQSIADLAKLAVKHHVNLISIGNGTGSRETERLVADMIKMYPDLQLTKVIVSEAGASVYSASELAAKEFPDLDVTLRGAVSIARRIQDPLAELVKIEAKSIGVGQYQHDVNQARLARCLGGVVEDCVNAVGVDVNTASAALLAHISGLNDTLAKNIVEYRDEHGAFVNRSQLKNINRMGEKAFQQAAGFLRIMNGDNPLDASCVHPEAYPLVERIIADKKIDIPQLIGNKEVLHSVKADQYIDEHYGLPTIRDVLRELEKPGRDPRPDFKTAQFKEGIEDINHLHEGMILEGVVSNVTNFGAFVDIGVHQDGLVHISAMTNRFISDPRDVVKAGDIVTVRVVEVNKERKRIGLSMKLEEVAASTVKKEAKINQTIKPVAVKKSEYKKKPEAVKKAEPVKKAIFNTAMADALAKLKRGAE